MQIESFEKACEIMGYDPALQPDVSMLPEIHQKAVTSGYQLFVISEASWKGDGKVIDWNDPSQRKWSSWFYLRKDNSNPSGFRFFDTNCDLTVTCASGGSRLCFPSDSDAEYHAEQHEQLYRDLMVFPSE